MASSMMVSASASAAVARTAAPIQPISVAPYSGLKSLSGFPTTHKAAGNDFSRLPTNGGRVQCIKVWPVEGLKKFETLSYLPPLSLEALLKQIEYLIRNNWIPCLEFSRVGYVYRENNRSPGYYDGRYWTMWKLPMFGTTDAVQVAKEIDECKLEHPDKHIRLLGFDNRRQVQCVSFLVYKPPNSD